MKKIVAHFIRKSTHLRASFIQNQITHHRQFDSVVVYKYHSNKNDGGFATFNDSQIPTLNLWDQKNTLSKLNYKFRRLITLNDKNKINAFITKNKIDIIHFHYGTDAGLYYPFLKNSNIPCVVSFYGYDCSGFPKIFFGRGRKYLKKRVFPHVNKVFAMSEDMKKDLMKIGCPEEKIIVHYYGSDVKKFYIKREYSSDQNVNFTIISGLEPQKGHSFLLKSFKQAWLKNNKISLNIYGSGSLEEKIKKFIENEEMSEYVSMNGPLIYGSSQHRDILKNADVFIHPSITDVNGDKEGIPGAIVEAMASGLPVISTYHAGIPYIIENNTSGLLVNEWDIDSLTKTILLISDDCNKRAKLGKNAQNYAIKNLDLFKNEEELEELYNKIIEEGEI